MKLLQVIIGYYIVYSLMSLFLMNFSEIITVFIFLLLLLIVKITPHPLSDHNPFAFAVHLRSLRLVHRR